MTEVLVQETKQSAGKTKSKKSLRMQTKQQHAQSAEKTWSTSITSNKNHFIQIRISNINTFFIKQNCKKYQKAKIQNTKYKQTHTLAKIKMHTYKLNFLQSNIFYYLHDYHRKCSNPCLNKIVSPTFLLLQ